LLPLFLPSFADDCPEQISDALVKLGNATGGYVPDIERFSGEEGKTVVGEAFTVEVSDKTLTSCTVEFPESMTYRW